MFTYLTKYQNTLNLNIFNDILIHLGHPTYILYLKLILKQAFYMYFIGIPISRKLQWRKPSFIKSDKNNISHWKKILGFKGGKQTQDDVNLRYQNGLVFL